MEAFGGRGFQGFGMLVVVRFRCFSRGGGGEFKTSATFRGFKGLGGSRVYGLLCELIFFGVQAKP